MINTWLSLLVSLMHLWAELESAKKEGRGTIIFNWTPNFTDAEGLSLSNSQSTSDGCRVEDGGDGSMWFTKRLVEESR